MSETDRRAETEEVWNECLLIVIKDFIYKYKRIPSSIDDAELIKIWAQHEFDILCQE